MTQVRVTIGVTVLALQVAMVVYARFHPMRYYCWAPYDSQNEYAIRTVVDGRELTRREMRKRYRLRTPGVNPRMITQVTDVVGYVERVYYPDHDASVTVTYRTNGHEEHKWTWPPN